MKILLLHPNFPAQFLNLCLVLGPHSGTEIVFLTQKKEGELPGVRKIYFDDSRESHPDTHPFVKSPESAILQGQSVCRAAMQLKSEGFEPDLILGHSGWGSTLFMRDLFPKAALVGYFEWFYHAEGADLDFDPDEKLNLLGKLRVRTLNLPFMMDLTACDGGICPTKWQWSQFPPEFQSKIMVCHDGVQTDRYAPQLGKRLSFPDLGINFNGTEEVVTYVGRGMETYRGFPQFMKAMEIVLKRRPNCHVVIVGAERIAYGGKKPDGYSSYKEWALKEVKLDWSRVHFTGLLPRNRYLEVLQVSNVHIYLTFPYVLSWSMMEAMSTGCLLVASDTQPVREMIEDRKNGLLVNFFDVAAIAERTIEGLSHQRDFEGVRAAARQTIIDKYDWRKTMTQELAYMEQVVAKVKQQSLQRRMSG